MPHQRFLAAVATLFLFAGAALTSGQAQTGRKPGAAQGQVPPQILKQFDTNGNGQLDPAEQQAAMQYMQQMQAGGGQPGAGPGFGGRPGAGGKGAGGMGGAMMNPQMQQQLLQKFDANGNGQLDPAEQQAASQFLQQMQQMQGGGGQGFGGRPGGGGMGAGAMMNPQMQQQLLQKFDANGNGQLDPAEQQAASQFMQQLQGGKGPGMGGRPGGGKGFGGRPGAGGMGAGGMGGAMMNPQMQQQLLQKFDANGNGQLDPNEQQAASQFLQQMQQMQGAGGQGLGGRPGGGQGFGGRPGAAGMGAGGQGLGGPGGAMMNPQMQQQLLQKFDKNGNGQLDPDEQQAAAQFMQQMQAGGGRGQKNN